MKNNKSAASLKWTNTLIMSPSSPRDLEDVSALQGDKSSEKLRTESDWSPPAIDRAELYDERRLEEVFCDRYPECNPSRPTHRHLTENCAKH
jgi:hypothetical protein